MFVADSEDDFDLREDRDVGLRQRASSQTPFEGLHVNREVHDEDVNVLHATPA